MPRQVRQSDVDLVLFGWGLVLTLLAVGAVVLVAYLIAGAV